MPFIQVLPLSKSDMDFGYYDAQLNGTGFPYHNIQTLLEKGISVPRILVAPMIRAYEKAKQSGDLATATRAENFIAGYLAQLSTGATIEPEVVQVTGRKSDSEPNYLKLQVPNTPQVKRAVAASIEDQLRRQWALAETWFGLKEKNSSSEEPVLLFAVSSVDRSVEDALSMLSTTSILTTFTDGLRAGPRVSTLLPDFKDLIHALGLEPSEFEAECESKSTDQEAIALSTLEARQKFSKEKKSLAVDSMKKESNPCVESMLDEHLRCKSNNNGMRATSGIGFLCGIREKDEPMHDFYRNLLVEEIYTLLGAPEGPPLLSVHLLYGLATLLQALDPDRSNTRNIAFTEEEARTDRNEGIENILAAMQNQEACTPFSRNSSKFAGEILLCVLYFFLNVLVLTFGNIWYGRLKGQHQ